MTTSTNIRGLAKHINQIFNTSLWDGIDFTLRKKTFVTDENGNVISSTNTDTTVKGVISSVPFAKEEMAGFVQDRQIRGVFLWTAAASGMPQVEDRILDDTDGNNVTYVIVEIPNVDWDIDNPVLITTILREVPDEH